MVRHACASMNGDVEEGICCVPLNDMIADNFLI